MTITGHEPKKVRLRMSETDMQKFLTVEIRIPNDRRALTAMYGTLDDLGNALYQMSVVMCGLDPDCSRAEWKEAAPETWVSCLNGLAESHREIGMMAVEGLGEATNDVGRELLAASVDVPMPVAEEKIRKILHREDIPLVNDDPFMTAAKFLRDKDTGSDE